MRKFVLSFAAAGAALALATPAAAQFYPQPQGYAPGYNNYGYVRALQARIDAVQYQINRLDRRDRIRDRTADRLRNESRSIERRLRRSAQYGLNPYEANEIQARIARLEQRLHYALRGSRHGRYSADNGYYAQPYDRDRDGRDDRYENDRGWDHDD
jgi:hypothetical protein